MDYSGYTITSCPGCQKSLSFTNPYTQLQVCTCGTVVERTEYGTFNAKPIGVLLHKHSFIQPGSTGEWESKKFTVLGRCFCWFDENVFSYWTIEWADRTVAWLGEGYGLFFIMQPVKQEKYISTATLDAYQTGSRYEIEINKEYLLEKKQLTLSWEMEGEVFLPWQPSQLRFFDFASGTGKRITIVDFKNNVSQCFDVTPVSLSALGLSNFREKADTTRRFSCKKCNTELQITTFPLAQSAACPSCGSTYVFQNGTDFKKDGPPLPTSGMALEIGMEGELKGVSFRVVGFTEKEEKSIGHSRWREYTLYNVQEGFVFLSEYDGHWMLLKETASCPVVYNQNDKEFTFDGKRFDLFNSYTYNIREAKGEFAFNIFDNENTMCREYIAPPFIWIQEKDKAEGIRWFKGQHITPGDISSAFTEAVLPRRVGVGAVQPGSVNRRKLILATLIGLALVLITHLLTTMNNKEQQLFFTNFKIPDTSNVVNAVTEKYVFDKSRSNLKLIISANVMNSWFELDATLVNAVTGKEYSLQQGVEYYFGYSGGESWTEGSQNENAYFKRIPAGTYFLQLQGTSDPGLGGVKDFYVEGVYDVTSNRNLWFSLLLFSLWPAIAFFYSHYQEGERWRNSPYSKYHEED